MHQHSLSEEVNTVRKARLRGWEGVLMFREGERKIGGKRERARDASTVDHALQNTGKGTRHVSKIQVSFDKRK